MKINYGEIISAGQEYNDAMNTFRSKYPGHNFISHANPDLYDAYQRKEKCERVVTVVCYVLGIPGYVPIQAARITNRLYDRAYKQGRDPGMIDDQRLVESLIANCPA